MKNMKSLIAVIFAFSFVSTTAATSIPTPKKPMATKHTELDLEVIADLEAWRLQVGQSLKRDNGWLTLAGRFVMKPGDNTFGTGKDNDIVFPPELTGFGPARLGVINVDPVNNQVTLTVAPTLRDVAATATINNAGTWQAEAKPFTGSRVLGTATDKRDWITFENIAMHVIARDGKYILRLANNKSLVRENFQGRIWYRPDAKFRVDAKYIPYPAGKTIPIVNVLDEISEEPSPGYVEFKLNGVKMKLDAVGDGDGLFFVMRDKTSGDTTYRPSRFLSVEKKPQPNKIFPLDFNRAYNPPCAFSEFTTCPLPPKQNILQVRIEAGEKYR